MLFVVLRLKQIWAIILFGLTVVPLVFVILGALFDRIVIGGLVRWQPSWLQSFVMIFQVPGVNLAYHQCIGKFFGGTPLMVLLMRLSGAQIDGCPYINPSSEGC